MEAPAVFRLHIDQGELLLKQWQGDIGFEVKSRLADGMLFSPVAMSHPETFAILHTALAGICDEFGLTGQRLDLILTPPWAVGWLIDVSEFPEDDLNDQIEWELSNRVDGNLDQSVFAWNLINTDAFALVLRAEVLEFWDKLFKELGIRLGNVVLRSGLVDEVIEDGADIFSLYRHWLLSHARPEIVFPEIIETEPLSHDFHEDEFKPGEDHDESHLDDLLDTRPASEHHESKEAWSTGKPDENIEDLYGDTLEEDHEDDEHVLQSIKESRPTVDFDSQLEAEDELESGSSFEYSSSYEEEDTAEDFFKKRGPSKKNIIIIAAGILIVVTSFIIMKNLPEKDLTQGSQSELVADQGTESTETSDKQPETEDVDQSDAAEKQVEEAASGKLAEGSDGSSSIEQKNKSISKSSIQELVSSPSYLNECFSIAAKSGVELEALILHGNQIRVKAAGSLSAIETWAGSADKLVSGSRVRVGDPLKGVSSTIVFIDLPFESEVPMTYASFESYAIEAGCSKRDKVVYQATMNNIENLLEMMGTRTSWPFRLSIQKRHNQPGYELMAMP